MGKNLGNFIFSNFLLFYCINVSFYFNVDYKLYHNNLKYIT